VSPRGRPGPKRAPARRPPPRGARGGPAPERRPAPRSLGGEQVEGRQAVRELLLAGRRRTKEVWLAEDVAPEGVVGDIVDLAGELRVPLQRVPRRRLDERARSEAPQGVLAVAAPLPEEDLDRLCRTGTGPPPFLVLLDGVTDPQNLGALLRSAECAGATGAVLPRHRSASITPTVAKAAAGAVEHLRLAVVPGIPGAMARARELGVWLVGLDAGGETSVFDLELATEPVGLVLGAEGRGLSRLTRTRCDVVAAIPLQGALGSLNVSAAGALACFEVARRRLVHGQGRY
jgi:23S rRNA (guanosine2251-2'-O)-methyltransferase